MKDHKKWMELCEQAAVEQDPQKLSELVAEIIRLMDEKQNRLDHPTPVNPPKS